MADANKFKKPRKSPLGDAHPPTEPSEALTAPETAPATPAEAGSGHSGAEPRPRDGRSLRASGRTVNFGTRVSQEFKDRLFDVAERENRPMNEVLERALEAYDRQGREG